MKNITKTALISIVMILSGTLSNAQENTVSQDSQSILPVRHEGEIAYVTGGIGDDEKQALEMVKKDYNLKILNSDREGAYVSDVIITIFDRKNNEILSSESGPFFYAQLPAGTYSIVAKDSSQEQKKKIKIPGKSSLHFVWAE